MKVCIVGTDTDIGKTYTTLALMKEQRQQGKCVVGIKPVATGCFMTKQGLRSPDALALQQASSFFLPYESVNPFAFAPPLSPHLVCSDLSVKMLMQEYEKEHTYEADCVFIEGIGGWQVPLNAKESMADFFTQLREPCCLVVGLKLGCFNHALLTREAMERSGVPFYGWVANHVDPSFYCDEETLSSLSHLLGEKPLRIFSYSGEEGS